MSHIDLTISSVTVDLFDDARTVFVAVRASVKIVVCKNVGDVAVYATVEQDSIGSSTDSVAEAHEEAIEDAVGGLRREVKRAYGIDI